MQIISLILPTMITSKFIKMDDAMLDENAFVAYLTSNNWSPVCRMTVVLNQVTLGLCDDKNVDLTQTGYIKLVHH